MTNALQDERGWMLVTATLLMTIMLSIAVVTLGLVDSDNHRTRNDREAESALNLDEGVLYAQSLVLAQQWPSLTAPAEVECKSSVVKAACPVAANLAGSGGSANFTNVDQQVSSEWTTKVRDNGGLLAGAYDPANADKPQPGCYTAAPCTYDANGDKELWVQARSVVRGQPRNVVARLRREELAENTPRTAVVAGALSVTNKGNHGGTPIIDATGSEVIVRCTGGNCVNAEQGQVVPPAHSGAAPSMMTPDQLQRFKTRAISDRRYYSGCPTPTGGSYDLSGKVVWVEGCADPPNLTNKVLTTPCDPPHDNLADKCVNTEDEPGLLIWHCGRADFSGGWTYRGVIYIVNNSDSTCVPPMKQVGTSPPTCTKQPSYDEDTDVVTTNGGFGIWGAIAVDGPGCLKVGSNGLQVKFDPRVFDAVESYGTVGLVQNTWRELPPNDI
jgi:Tfp pilus assembly protein PilX